MNKIAVFGASGRTGKLFTELALKNGYEVKALVRDPSRLDIRHSNLQVIQGDIADAIKVDATVKATEAVIVLINAAKGPPETMGAKNPLGVMINLINPAEGSHPTRRQIADLLRTATGNILSAMQQNNVERLIVVDSLPGELVAGILDPNDEPRFMNKWFVNNFTIFITKNLFGELVEAGRENVDLIRQSPLRWTIVRAPTLNDQPSRGNYRVGYLDADTGRVASRTDLAAFLLDVLVNGKYVREMPLISS
jgi:NAD(P)-dependent dehydrogenase (short-subunit alcohol dehydrogenase family)